MIDLQKRSKELQLIADEAKKAAEDAAKELKNAEQKERQRLYALEDSLFLGMLVCELR